MPRAPTAPRVAGSVRTTVLPVHGGGVRSCYCGYKSVALLRPRMAFDNVTLFEINVEDPFSDRTDGTRARAESVSGPTDDAGSDSGSSGGRGRRLLGLFVVVGVLAGVAYWLNKRRGGDEDDFETEEIEPGVERVEA